MKLKKLGGDMGGGRFGGDGGGGKFYVGDGSGGKIRLLKNQLIGHFIS